MVLGGYGGFMVWLYLLLYECLGGDALMDV